MRRNQTERGVYFGMLNKAILMGRLTRDPELRHTQNNTPVASFRLAVDRGRKSADPNQPTADFIDIVAWNQTAEFVSRYFRKGQLVAVSGRIQTRNWTDNNGNNRIAFEIIADEVHFAEPKRDSYDSAPSMGGGGPQGGYSSPAPTDRGMAPAAPQQPYSGAGGFGGGFDEITDDDGDLPF